MKPENDPSPPHVLFDEPKPLSLPFLAALALGLGVFTGGGAVVFRLLIGLIHNFAFLGHWSFHYNASLFTGPSPWGAGIILVPIIGGLIVTFLVVNFAPEARGHGVPEVMDAIFYKDGIIRPVVAAVKSVASAIAIGTGAAVGREGPIIQIGSAFGSTLGQVIDMPPFQRIILVAAGAGAGIAATFNTPIGGVMFALELMLPEISVSSFLPVALATGAATFIGRALLGSQPAFFVPPLPALGTNLHAVGNLFLFAALGGLAGLASGGFIRGLYVSEVVFERIRNPYVRHIIGMLLMGLLIYGILVFTGHYFVEGVGYAMIQALLTAQLAPGASLAFFAGLLVLLFIAKLFATCMCLGSGSSGGIFSPSLFMGASIGGAFAAIMQMMHLAGPADITSFAMVGMAAMVGGGTGAVMTAVTMIFEMTRDYGIVMPMIIAVAVAVGVRRLLAPESIYTIKLVKRGHFIPKALHADMFLVRQASDIMEEDIRVLPGSTPFEALISAEEETGRMRHAVITQDGLITGVLRVNMALRKGLAEAERSLTLADIASKRFVVVHDTDIAHAVIGRMWRRGAIMAVVTRGAGQDAHGQDVIGVITKEHLADSVASAVIHFRND
ncbi:chloride channel protein [Acidocella aminolytica]|uniref:Chloride channel voltage-gated protein n=1 Tax=Acidocella aminolytica 101 = DSM 11237 TaxID=1120923 RepID=A0A0D6PBE5_9PROT|nr:chloride channel protein [Acidocella aminolytica]GAN78656.1 chloride channel voltage-gated protein [Acidocella aminolytica 101 = DSM 11237]SHE44540.1 chloride channel protein, CIC family [Acidocella aminolytica 101 = DSM 11237]